MNANILVKRSDRTVWFSVLGAFTLWLVIQNAVLLTIVSVTYPEFPVAVVVEAARVLARVVTLGGQIVASIAAGLPGSLSSAVTAALTGGLL
jgi:fumarate reductase subunit D